MELRNIDYIFTVKKNQIRMMRDRGFMVDKEDLSVLDMTIDQFDSFMTKTPTHRIHSLNKLYENEKGQKIYVYFIAPSLHTKKVCTAQIKGLSTLVYSMEDVQDFLVISETKFHNQARDTLFSQISKNFVIMLYEELLYYIFDSPFVPKYEILSEDQIKETFFDSGKPLIRKSALPHLRVDDPVAKFLGLKPGQIVKFISRMYYTRSLVDSTVKYLQVTNESIFATTKDEVISVEEDT